MRCGAGLPVLVQGDVGVSLLGAAQAECFFTSMLLSVMEHFMSAPSNQKGERSSSSIFCYLGHMLATTKNIYLLYYFFLSVILVLFDPAMYLFTPL